MSTMNAMHRWIIAVPIEEDIVTAAGLHIPQTDEAVSVPLRATVICAPEDTKLSEGDIVMHTGGKAVAAFRPTIEAELHLAIEINCVIGWFKKGDTDVKRLHSV